MKKVHALIISLVAVVLLCASCNRPNAPDEKVSNVDAPASGGGVLTVKITDKAPLCEGLMLSRNGGNIEYSEPFKLPYEKTFQVKSGESFIFTADAKGPSARMTISYNGQEVSSGVGFETIMKKTPPVYVVSCAYTVP